jgi:hypothetical protein
MILLEDYVYYAIELRLKTRQIVGSLCKVRDVRSIHNAMKFFDIWNHKEFISHPFAELDDEIFRNMTFNVFRIFIEINNLYMPPFTKREIQGIIRVSKKYGYVVTQNNGFISIRLEVPNENSHIRH